MATSSLVPHGSRTGNLLVTELYSLHAAEAILTCSRKEFRQAQKLLSGGLPLRRQRRMNNYREMHGFAVDFVENGLYLYADYSGDACLLPMDFTKLLGTWVARQNLAFLEIGFATTCSRPERGSQSGGAWRLYPDGSIQFAELVFPNRQLEKDMVLTHAIGLEADLLKLAQIQFNDPAYRREHFIQLLWNYIQLRDPLIARDTVADLVRQAAAAGTITSI